MSLTAADLKTQMQFTFTQKIREFEHGTDMRVVGIKIKRDECGEIESLTIKAEMRDSGDE